jgi:hypothetical protein
LGVIVSRWEGAMRRFAVLLLASFVVSIASGGKRNPNRVSGTIGVVTSDRWCKTIGIRGTCGALLDVPTQFVGSDAGLIGSGPSAVNVAAPVPTPVTQIIQVEGPNASYTVRFVSLTNGLDFPPQSRVEFAVEGKHLLFRLSGNEYKTDILVEKKRKP